MRGGKSATQDGNSATQDGHNTRDGNQATPDGNVALQTECGDKKKDPKDINRTLNGNNRDPNGKYPAFAAKPTKKPDSGRTSTKPGKNNLNVIQINTCKSRNATRDLVNFTKNYTLPIMLVQEPYVNGKNAIPRPSGDIVVVVGDANSKDCRPRACIYHHKCLTEKVWHMATLSSRDCTTIQIRINNVPTLMVSCYMDRLDSDCPPESFKKAAEYANKHNMALIAGVDANAHNTYWNSRITDKTGAARGDALLDYIVKEKLFVENVGDAAGQIPLI